MGGQIVLGLGGTVDYELAWDAQVMSRLAGQHGLTSADLSLTAPIVDERSLLSVILAFLEAGEGGERFVSSSALVEEFAENFAYETTLGGTGVRAGLVLDRLGIGSVQHLVSIDETVRRLLPGSMSVVSSATEDTLDPHLIVQFPAGAKVTVLDRELVSPAANRLILANDPPNRLMALAPGLRAALAEAQILLVSGFNTMQHPALLRSRVSELRSAMEDLPPDALVFYEDAGFYERSLSDSVREGLLDRIDVYSMNEDELQEYLGRRVDLLAPGQVVAALREARRLIPARTLVVHTRFWAIALGCDATRLHAALRSAVEAAATRYRLGDRYDAADLSVTAALARHAGGAAVVEALVSAVPHATGVAAFDLDTPSPTTIGLGDTFVGGFLAELALERSAIG